MTLTVYVMKNYKRPLESPTVGIFTCTRYVLIWISSHEEPLEVTSELLCWLTSKCFGKYSKGI